MKSKELIKLHMDFKTFLQTFKKDNNLTNSAMAKMIGVPERTFQDWIYDKHSPDIFKQEVIKKILKEKSTN